MNVGLIQIAIAYHHTLYQRVWDSIMTLTDEQFVAPIDYSIGSIRNQMIHVATTDRRWLLGMQGDPAARQLVFDPDDYPTRAAARTLWDEVTQQLQTHVQGLTDADLAQHPPGMPGPAWQVLLHLVNHGTDHRAQILRALHDFGAPTFDQDLILHLWQQ